MPVRPEHKKRSWVQERTPFTRRKDNSKFYNGRKWRKVSKSFRELHPLCAECERNNTVGPAEVCDHIRGLDYLIKNGLDPYNVNELQSMCHKCHNKKSGRDAHKKHGDG